MLRNLGNLKFFSLYLTLNDKDTSGDSCTKSWCSVIVDAFKMRKCILSVNTYGFDFEYEELKCNILFSHV